MKKLFIFLASVLMVTLFNANSTFALSECKDNTCPVKPATEEQQTPAEAKAEAKAQVEEVKQDLNVESIKCFFNNFAKYQNAHNISALKKIYTEDYVNSDGFNKQQLFKLMERTYSNYPDITNTYTIDEIITSGNYAMIYVSQNTTATTKAESQITGDKGTYNAKLKLIIYLKKEAKNWKIYSETTTYEYSVLAYGMAKDVKTTLKAPQKVLNNTDYSAGLEVEIPPEYTAIASINSTQIVEDFNLQGESFRQVALDKGYLERIIKANGSNNNEAVVVSVGFTKQNTDMFKKPKIELSGLLMLMQRVDVIPVTSNAAKQKEQESAKK